MEQYNLTNLLTQLIVNITFLFVTYILVFTDMLVFAHQYNSIELLLDTIKIIGDCYYDFTNTVNAFFAYA